MPKIPPAGPAPPPPAPGARAAPPEQERLVAALARHLLALLPPDRPHGRADLTRLPLPVAHHLEGTLDRRLARDAALPASPWFDGEAETVHEAARAWRSAVRATARFPAEAWAEAVHASAAEVLAYLAEPVEALAAHVYAGNEGPLPVETLRARMAAFSPYPYLREIAEGYFDRKGVEAVSRDEFERLLRRIDRRMVSLFGPHDWLALLEPLFALLRPLPEDGRVPAPLLRRFLAAKGYDDLAAALDAGAYDEAALRAALDAALPDLDAEEKPAEGAPRPEHHTAAVEPEAPEPEYASEPTAEAEPEAGTAPEADPEPEAEPALEPEAAASPEPESFSDLQPTPEPEARRPETDAEEPLWMRLARRREETPSAPETAPKPAPETPPAAPPAARSVASPTSGSQPEAGEPEPLWRRFAGGAPAPAGPAPDASAPGTPDAPTPGAPREPLARLETRVLGPSATERRDWYVRHLTGGSEADYRAVLEQLDAAADWTAASQVIAREIFRKHRVNIYADAAVAFTDAAEARFARRR